MGHVGPPVLIAHLTAQFRLDLEWIILATVLVGLVLLGIIVIVRYKRWQAAEQTPAPPTRLEEYQALMEQGLLDPQEFERIRDSLQKNSEPPTSPPAESGPADHGGP
jgi:hypothetical protein